MRNSQQRGLRLPPDVMEAARELVREFGVSRLAALTGTPAGTLYNKTSDAPDNFNKPTLADALVWSQLAHANGVADPFRIADTFCRALGGVFVPLHGLAEHSDAALLDLILKRGRENGEFDAELIKALDDGNVSAADYRELHREGFEGISAVLELLHRLEDMSR